jgi:hypothetical protein
MHTEAAGSRITLQVSLQADEAGMVGRHCPSCDGIFKVKSGTVLPSRECGCPYCEHRAGCNAFVTDDQLEYAKSVAIKKVVEPGLEQLKEAFERLNDHPSNGFFRLRASVTLPVFSLHSYTEPSLETNVTCQECGFVFSIFGVFASCPDCGKTNAFQAFETNVDLVGKVLDLAERDDLDVEAREVQKWFALSQAVAAFDSVGKHLRKRHPSLFPAKTKNLFQNLDALDEALVKAGAASVRDRLPAADHDHLVLMFQVRHLAEHTGRVVDDDAVSKVPELAALRGRLYPLTGEEARAFVSVLRLLIGSIRDDIRVRTGQDEA